MWARLLLLGSAPVRAAVALAALALVAMLGTPATAATIVIASNASDPAPRRAWEGVVRRFEAEHPGIRVELSVYDHESYKKALRGWLTGVPPDVVFWFAGHRMRQLVTPGLLDDVSALYTPERRAELHPGALALVSVGTRQYGVPYQYYPVGLYYRRDLFAGAGIVEAPRTWEALLDACDRLKLRGIEPVAIGTRDLWPAAAWFDYLDLRRNGLAFHLALMEGKVAYTDPRVRAVFADLGELVTRGCFTRNHASVSWQESQALLYNGTAAMMLIGNYIVANFPADVRERIDFAPFPVRRTGMPRYEEAPMNTLHIPARASNKDDARAFLAYLLRPDVQEALNRELVQLPVNRRAAIADDRFLAKGRSVLDAADGFAQYFDRDTDEDVANIGMKGMQEFMLKPERLDAILGGIERARARVYGAPAPSLASP